MSIPVQLSELADAMERYRFAYLLTVGDDIRPHAVAVAPVLSGGVLTITTPGRRSSANAAARPAVSLVWPPPEDGGYSLIVDGDASGDGDVLTIQVARAVLHRPAAPDTSSPGGACGSDCVEIGPDAS